LLLAPFPSGPLSIVTHSLSPCLCVPELPLDVAGTVARAAAVRGPNGGVPHPEMSRVESQASLTSGKDRLVVTSLEAPFPGEAGQGGAAGARDGEEAEAAEEGEGEEGDEEWALEEEEGVAQGAPGSGELWRGGVKRKRRSTRGRREPRGEGRGFTGHVPARPRGPGGVQWCFREARGGSGPGQEAPGR